MTSLLEQIKKATITWHVAIDLVISFPSIPISID